MGMLAPRAMSKPGSPQVAVEAAPPCCRSVDAGVLLPASERESPQQASRVDEAITSVARVLLRLFAALAILTLGRFTLADQYHVPTGSMWPTISPGDHILVDKTAYGLRVPFGSRYLIARSGPRPGEVVLFVDPRGGPVLLVKRVVALAGQTVAVHQGVLYVDGVSQRLEQLGDGTTVEHLGAVTHAAGERDFVSFGPAVVPPGHLFLMGDNRAASLDSRAMGAVPESLVRGRVMAVLYHVDSAGLDPSRLLLPLD
jgi:signal peptidase I